MLILECSQGCYGRTDDSVTISLRNFVGEGINTRFLYQIGCWIVLYLNYFNKTWIVCSLFKAKQSTCQVLNMTTMGTFLWK